MAQSVCAATIAQLVFASKQAADYPEDGSVAPPIRRRGLVSPLVTLYLHIDSQPGLSIAMPTRQTEPESSDFRGSVLFVPIHVGSRYLGTLTIESPGEPDESVKLAMQSLADQLAAELRRYVVSNEIKQSVRQATTGQISAVVKLLSRAEKLSGFVSHAPSRLEGLEYAARGTITSAIQRRASGAGSPG